MVHKLLIRDLTLRDGQQSAFATRMSQQQIDRVLPYYNEAGFYAMEVWGGAVPDSVMRYLDEDPWERLEKIKAVIGKSSRLTALSRGRNLFGYNPYTDSIIEGFCRHSIASGLDVMRIFDALNDVENVMSTIRYVKQYGGVADCAVCFTLDPHFSTFERIRASMQRHPLPRPIFTDEYFLEKAMEMEALGADMITIKDMSGLILPGRAGQLVKLFKEQLHVPVDFHTHCTPGYGLASVLAAIMNGADIVDTNIWNFAGGPAAPAVELVYIFCTKLGIELDLNLEAIARINDELLTIRKELSPYDVTAVIPHPFNLLTDRLPTQIDRFFNDAIDAVRKGNEEDVMLYCRAIEEYFNFPEPNELVRKAEIPGGMFSNMVAQLKQTNELEILERALALVPMVRMDAGLPPLVTPTSQIIGAQAVSCALDQVHDRPLYSYPSNQFLALIAGEYGRTPLPVDPEFRYKLTGKREETPYDMATYEMQDNPILEAYGYKKLADNEKEVLLLELFPTLARNWLLKKRKKQASC